MKLEDYEMQEIMIACYGDNRKTKKKDDKNVTKFQGQLRTKQLKSVAEFYIYEILHI